MLNPVPVGDAIADYIKNNPPPSGPNSGPALQAYSKTLWEQIITILYNDLKANMGVQPGSFNVVVPPGGSGGTFPVLGSGGPAT